MDTSKEYILMCREATELQKNHEFTVGDFYYYHSVGVDDGNEYPAPSNAIWLFRQDQLQDMMFKIEEGLEEYMGKEYTKNFAFSDLAHQFYHFCEMQKFNSYEQHWLAFVMQGKYNKIWKGDKWLLE